ncbi:MAG: GHKL domain-containing protein [Candidatus Faecimonas sp.]|nr:GHKL domain-containing protein [Candidatus Faecimonas sp.]
MLEVLARIFCALIITITGTHVINSITKKETKIINYNKNIIAILATSLCIGYLYKIDYTGLATIVIYLLYIITYKFVYKLSIEEATISSALFMVILALADVLTSLIFMNFYPANIIRANSLFFVLSNITVSIITILLIKVKWINITLNKFYCGCVHKQSITNIIFFSLLIIGFSYLIYNIGLSKIFSKEYLINFIVLIIYIIITYIFIGNQNKYKKLETEYDTLFKYIQTFEDWIEKEQLNRHEYKNQLAVLRCLTKDKKVKDKIDEILEDNINIEGQEVTNFKNLPKGGLKGLMYYKAAIAQKQKIHLTTDVCIEKNCVLTKLSEKEIRILCKLIGIYFDNAIEAAVESRKKNITIEIYELKDRVNFIFSNTFKKHKNMQDRNKKGVSSKGEGRGNGLYFANKLIKENSWIEEKQEIIDNYYVQQISVKTKK